MLFDSATTSWRMVERKDHAHSNSFPNDNPSHPVWYCACNDDKWWWSQPEVIHPRNPITDRLRQHQGSRNHCLDKSFGNESIHLTKESNNENSPKTVSNNNNPTGRNWSPYLYELEQCLYILVFRPIHWVFLPEFGRKKKEKRKIRKALTPSSLS